MPEQHLARYPLTETGAIHHYLGCGPLTSPLLELQHVLQPDSPTFGDDGRWILNYWAYDPASAALKLRIYNELPPLVWQPGPQPTLNSPAFGDRRWGYLAAEEDHIIDFSRFNFTPTRMQGWLFTCLEVDQPMTVRVQLFTIGPARLWLNGALQLHFKGHFSYVALQTIPLTLTLTAGLNDLYLQGEMLGWREARLALGLCFPDREPILNAVPLGNIPAGQWQQAETGLANVLVRQFAFPELPACATLDRASDESFTFEAEAEVPIPDNAAEALVALIPPKGHAQLTLAPGETGVLPVSEDVARSLAALSGENTLRLRLTPADGTPLEVTRTIWASANRFSDEPYGDYESRRREALEHLAHIPYDVLASMAAVEIGQAVVIDSEAIRTACHFLNNRFDCADFYAIELLAMLYRFGDHPALHRADREQVENAFRGFKFWIDEPGLDAMCYFTENHQILFHVTAYLAGQFWPDQTFTNSGWTGRSQQERAAPRIESWIRRRLGGNFSEWDSNAYMALDLFAMLALVEFAANLVLRELAINLLHKIFFLIASQSFRGAHGSTHGRCYVTGLKSARVENTSSIQRIAWGMGIFNGETRATGLLALARRYRVPEIIQQIGADLPDVLVTRAHSIAELVPESDMKTGSWDVRTITRRTPDGMLSAAVDHRPGEMGVQEHLWQATLGPDAVVFTTYPGNSQEHGNARPNFWAGSARLPRVAMHNRSLVCLYRFQPGVGLGFSHAYFPTATFDEYRIVGQWAFARLGDGYVALAADGDLFLTERGRHAGQELRSRGAGEVWVCQIGRAAEDRSFGEFCEGLLKSSLQMKNTAVEWITPQGENLSFDWASPFTVNGRPWDLESFPHYENRYTDTPLHSSNMVLRHLDEELIVLRKA